MTSSRSWGRAFRLALLFVAACACVAPSFSGPTLAAGPQAAAVPLALAPAGGVSSLQATSATLTGLVYQDNETASTAAGDVVTMKFTATSALFDGLEVQSGCEAAGPAGTARRSHLLASSALAPAPDGLTFWATSVTGTSAPVWTPAAPPGPAGTALGDLTIPGLVVQLVQASTPVFHIPSSGSSEGALRQFTEFCTP